MNALSTGPYSGKRHFIIGSGKSLLSTPLDALEGEVTWAMNRIHLLYDRTSWRPTFYFSCDFNSQNPRNYWHDCIRAHWDTPKFLWEGFRDGSKLFPDLEPIGNVP